MLQSLERSLAQTRKSFLTRRSVNQDSQGEGWFFKMRVDDPFSLDGLMDEDAYKALVDFRI